MADQPVSSNPARQYLTLVAVAVAAGAASAALAACYLRPRQQRDPPPPPQPDQPDATQPQPAPEQQPPRTRRRPAPPPVRSPFHDALRGSSVSAERCWEWLSASEEGDPEFMAPSEPLPSAGSLPMRQALRRHKQQQQQQEEAAEAERQRQRRRAERPPSPPPSQRQRQEHQRQQQQRQQQPQQRNAGESSTTRSFSALPPEAVDSEVAEPEQQRCRSTSEPAVRRANDGWDAAGLDAQPGQDDNLLPGLRRVSVRSAGGGGASGAAAPAESSQAASPDAAAGAGRTSCRRTSSGRSGSGTVRAVTWGPAISNLPQPAALSLSAAASPRGGAPAGSAQPQRTVAEALMRGGGGGGDSVRSASGSSAGSGGTVPLEELRLYHKPDGSPWVLGAGALVLFVKHLLDPIRDLELTGRQMTAGGAAAVPQARRQP